MKKIIKNSILFLMMLICASIIGTCKPEYCKAEESDSIWDKENVLNEKVDNMEYTVYLSKDKKYCWVKKIAQVKKKKMSKLVIPNKIKGAIVTTLGIEVVHDDDSEYVPINLFGGATETFHNASGYYALPSKITQVVLPSTVTDIKDGAFSGFCDLESIVIPNGVKTIYETTFYYCSSLKRITLPAELENFNVDALRKCKSLSSISIGKGSKNFVAQNGMLFSKDKKTLVCVQPKIDKLTIPSCVKTVGEGAMRNSYVKKVYIPKSVTLIENESFNGSKIQSITISKDNKRYGIANNCVYSKKTKRAVVLLTKKGNVTLPSQVYYLKDNLSIAGDKIKTLTIPSTFKEFKSKWYENSRNIMNTMTVTFKSKTPPNAEKESLPYGGKFIVPKGCKEKYEKWYVESYKDTDYERWYAKSTVVEAK